MNEIFDYLDSNYNIYDSYENNNKLTHIYAEDNLLYYCIIAPHEGNDYSFLLRVNTKKTFDRWSICEFEEKFSTSEKLIKFLKKDKERIYREILAEVLEYHVKDFEE